MLKILLLLLFSHVLIAGNQDLLIEHFYTDKKNNYLVRFFYKPKLNPEFMGKNVTFYGNDSGLWQLHELNYAGGLNNFTFVFTDPKEPNKKAFFTSSRKSRNTLTCSNKTMLFSEATFLEIQKMQQRVRDGLLALKPLPRNEFEPLYIFEQEGFYVYLDRPRYYAATENTVRLFQGKPGRMLEKSVYSYVSYFDLTSYIEAEDGASLYIPGAVTTSPASWIDDQGMETLLKMVKINTFDLKTLKIPGLPSKQAALKTPCHFN